MSRVRAGAELSQFLRIFPTYSVTSHQQRGYAETQPRFKVSSERLEKWGIDLAIPRLVGSSLIHYTTVVSNKTAD